MVKRTALLIILIVTVFFLAGCIGGKKDGNGEPKSEGGSGNSAGNTAAVTSAEHFPAGTGLYKRFKSEQEEWEETVGEPETYEGKKVIPIHTKKLNRREDQAAEGGEFDVNEYTNFYVVGQEVLFVGSRANIDNQVADESIPVPSVIFKTGLKQGESWTYELYYPPGQVKATVEDFETLKTQAGTFAGTVRIKLDYNYLDEEGREIRATAYEWYAPGYGKVKSQGAGEMGMGEVVEVKK
ncbi:hypothetical protein FDZ73_21140 [bacterium]|nr:MAG: hypothetical protein FDZ73_21140 [bacterium]